MSESLKNPARYTITAALPYTNGPIHIGHLAGVYVPADIYSRYLRLIGKDVAFVCGSDEHGVAISMKAKKEGISPKEVIDKYPEVTAHLFKTMTGRLKKIQPDHRQTGRWRRCREKATTTHSPAQAVIGAWH